MTKHTILAILIVLDVIVIFARGAVRHTKTYDGYDAFGVLLVGPLYLWLLLS